MTNLLGEPPETFLPEDPGAAMLAEGSDPKNVASLHPDSVSAWITLAETALDDGIDLEGYAFARTGYHRCLDMLRRSGWKGHGPVPWSHEPNQPFLRALAALAEASARLGDDAETHRCREFLHESSPEAYAVLVK
ncbi:DUF3151 domain-containing protein [Aeromicrobium sp. CF3.5]|uniref:DUF3151 domain-containing protein n=1 Tax=Aeromicrobium sp. CF3.5 TaxID=3373078 RepID=UPI003EE54B07